ncbi:putative Yif1 family protein [Helianthus anomalus]
MYDPLGNPLGGARPPSNTTQTPFGNPLYGGSSGLIRGGLGAYGEKILGSSSEYVQSNVSNIAIHSLIIFRPDQISLIN